jgi:hypothetical protein
MNLEISKIRKLTVANILAKQDEQFRWAFNEQMARERPELIYYWPKYKSTLWTLLLLADIKAPIHNWQIEQSIHHVMNNFYDKTHKIYTLGSGHFPVPCLNGNMLYLHFYFNKPYTKKINMIVEFFNTYQRFDDGDYITPKTFPYYSNTSCYGKHTCYWGVVKLFKGLSFIPKPQRTKDVKRLIENCIEFILHHEVCFRSHNKVEFIQSDIGALTFPNLGKDDYLEILWLLSREGIRDKNISRAVELLRSKINGDGFWELERPVPNLIVSMGKKGCANSFIPERALKVLDYYGH